LSKSPQMSIFFRGRAQGIKPLWRLFFVLRRISDNG
jgi:hypothetical protein